MVAMILILEDLVGRNDLSNVSSILNSFCSDIVDSFLYEVKDLKIG
jgi:hypothetical protein